MTWCTKCEEEMIVYGWEPNGKRDKCPECGWEVYTTEGIPNCMQCGREMEYVKGSVFQCTRCQKRVKL